MQTRCPSCDADVSPNAKSCPECGRRFGGERSWEQDESYDGLGLPIADEDFDYEEFIEKEFDSGKDSPWKMAGLAWYWWLVAILLLAAFLFSLGGGVW